MNKALHVFVYLFLIMAGVALYLEMQLNENRKVLSERNRQQEEYLVQLAAQIEEEKPDKTVTLELKKDISSIEAKPVDIPATEDMLDGYNAWLEQTELKPFSWNNDGVKAQLRRIYEIDELTGKPRLDAGMPIKDGPNTAKTILDKLLLASQDQKNRLNDTRKELKRLRGKLESAVEEINKLKPEGREREITIAKKNKTIEDLEKDKADLENENTRLTSDVKARESEISALNEEKTDLLTTLENTRAQMDDLKQENERNKKLIQDLNNQIRGGNRTASGIAVSTIPAGDKGRIISADNDNMFAVVEFTPEAMVQLKGEEGNNPLPFMEFGVKRPGFNGEAGEFVGRIRLRQEVAGKNFIICDILSNWSQDTLKPNDVIFAD